MGLTTRKTGTVAFGLVPTRQPSPCKPGISPRIKYLSSEHIVTWCIRELCSFKTSLMYRSAILNLSNIGCVAVKNPRFGRDFVWSFIATKQILFEVHWRPRGERAPKTGFYTYRPCLDTIRTRKLNWRQNYRNREMEPRSGCNQAKKPWVHVQSG